jgi:hypothetical protein
LIHNQSNKHGTLDVSVLHNLFCLSLFTLIISCNISSMFFSWTKIKLWRISGRLVKFRPQKAHLGIRGFSKVPKMNGKYQTHNGRWKIEKSFCNIEGTNMKRFCWRACLLNYLRDRSVNVIWKIENSFLRWWYFILIKNYNFGISIHWAFFFS